MSDPSARPHYGRVWLTFVRNSLVREMTFRGNFLVEVLTRAFWFAAQLTLFEIIYRNVDSIGPAGTDLGWSRGEYFAFMATGMLINALVETFFMPNCANFSEMIRKGDLDFVLLKPIDTQFLVSFEKVKVAMLNQILLAVVLLAYATSILERPVTPAHVAGYVLLLLVGVAFFYSLMIALASTSIWFGRNQGLYDFWFYVTVFARYPRSIYANGWIAGDLLQFAFSFVLPILLVVTVPARLIVSKVVEPSWLAASVIITALCLVASRAVFNWSLAHYRSASS